MLRASKRLFWPMVFSKSIVDLRCINLNELCSAIEAAPVRRAGALVHVAARGLSGAGAADDPLFSVAVARRRASGPSCCGRRAYGRSRRSTVLLIVWAAAVTAYIAFHDDLIAAVVARQAAMESAYESRLAEARARLDEVAEPAGARPQNSFEAQAQRTHVPAGPAREARRDRRRARRRDGRAQPVRARGPSRGRRSPADALGAIQALGPPTAGRRRRRRGARLCPSPGPQRRAAGGQASSGR